MKCIIQTKQQKVINEQKTKPVENHTQQKKSLYSYKFQHGNITYDYKKKKIEFRS